MTGPAVTRADLAAEISRQLQGYGSLMVVAQQSTAVYPVLAGEVGVVRTDYPAGDIRRYGSPMDGASDDAPGFTLAIQNAIAFGKTNVRLPSGVITPLSNLSASVTGATPKTLRIVGYGYNTIIKPGAAVTKCLTLAGDSNTDGVTNRVTLERVRIDGVNTTSAVGLMVGENAGNLSGYITLRDVEVYRFTGAGGRNIYIKDLVGLLAENVYSGRGETNLYVAGSDPALPTVVTFGKCQFREATKNNVVIDRGYNIRFRECVNEASTLEGWKIVPPAGNNATLIDIDGGWTEACNTVGNFQLVADGSALGTSVEVRIAHHRFASPAKSISLKSVANFVIDDIRLNNRADDVHIDTNCSGDIRSWPENNFPYATCVTNLSGDAVAWPERYVPRRDVTAYGATVTIDVSLGDHHAFSVSNATAFTVANPTNAVAGVKQQTVNMKNISGGAMGAVTWGTKYKLAAWTNPANGFQRSITFQYEWQSDTWVEVSRTPADVPN